MGIGDLGKTKCKCKTLRDGEAFFYAPMFSWECEAPAEPFYHLGSEPLGLMWSSLHSQLSIIHYYPLISCSSSEPRYGKLR